MPTWTTHRQVMAALLFFALEGLLNSSAYDQTSSHPSAYCHVTDGAFTVCPINGNQEWSDVPSRIFPSTGAFLYADQADLDPVLAGPRSAADTLMLMYDECGRRSPLGTEEYVRISFDTVEIEDGVEELEHYIIHAFTDGTIVFFENGQLQRDPDNAARAPEIAGQRGHVGFGPSPNCPFDHVITEFETKLSATDIDVNGAYSPDPIFWGSDVPPEPPPLPECPDAGSSVPVQLSQVTAPVNLALKPYQVIYDNLSLDFTSGGDLGSDCSVTSNVGSLSVQLDLLRGTPPGPFEIATSSAASTLDFFDSGNFDASGIPACDFGAVSTNCFVNAQPGASSKVVRWHTNGFEEAAFGIPVSNSGPLTFYVNVDDLSGPAESFPELLQTTEQYIHQTLISHLSAIDSLAVIQDPPADLLVTDPSGRRTGVGAGGSTLSEIPGSGYFRSPELSAVILVEPLQGAYSTQIVGLAGQSFSLSMSQVELHPTIDVPAVRESLASGTIDPAGSAFAFVVAPVRTIGAAVRSGFDLTTLPRNDDGSTSLVPMGFTANFFGTEYSTLYVNNNGNVTFDSPQSEFTPFSLAATGRAIIAPFFADVDTRNAGDPVRYGTGIIADHPSFGVSWRNVDCYASSPSRTVRNSFQVILVDRSDLSPGDFDIEFNYDQIQWETGQASGGSPQCLGGASGRAGFSNGSGAPGTFFELPGSGTPGAFLDSNPVTGLIQHSLNDPQPGRYLFSVRSGVPNTQRDKDDDGVADDLDDCPTVGDPAQIDSDLDGIGDACGALEPLHSTAAFLQALLDGGTTVEPKSILVAEAPGLLDRLIRIVEFRVREGLTPSATALAANLVASQVELGLVPPEQEDDLIDAVVRGVNQNPVADAGVDQVVECAALDGTQVRLNGMGTTDPDGDPITYTWTGVFGTATGSSPTVTLPLGDHSIMLSVDDGQGGSATDTVDISVRDTTSPVIVGASSNPGFLWPPNHTMRGIVIDYSATDLCSPTSCSLAVTSNEPINGTGDGDATPDWSVLDDHHLDLRAERSAVGHGRTYTTTITCADVSRNAAADSTATIVKHDMSSPESGSAFKVGSSVSFAGSFWDVPGRTHLAQWTFDSLTSPGTVTEPTATRPGLIRGTYAFAAPGVYGVKMSVKDSSGTTSATDAMDGVNALVVIYDRNGGSVTGGGWIASPPGAYVAAPALVGNANFGFVSQYFKNASNPKGETEFDIRVAGFKFNALNFEYLAISGARAQYRGAGKVNGNAGYAFILTVIDGQATGGGGVDRFRMKIWNKTTGTVVYDTQLGASDNADPMTPVSTGSGIVIRP